MKISKYKRCHRFAQYDRFHRHGWIGWEAPRLKRLGKRKDHGEKADPDNWENDQVRVLDLTSQPPEGV